LFLEDEQQKETILQQELGFFMELIRINPKSYWLWNHRQWCLATMAKPNWQQELKLVGKMLDMDARNCKLLKQWPFGVLCTWLTLCPGSNSSWMGLSTLCCWTNEKMPTRYK
jgi:hypothetical protein